MQNYWISLNTISGNLSLKKQQQQNRERKKKTELEVNISEFKHSNFTFQKNDNITLWMPSRLLGDMPFTCSWGVDWRTDRWTCADLSTSCTIHGNHEDLSESDMIHAVFQSVNRLLLLTISDISKIILPSPDDQNSLRSAREHSLSYLETMVNNTTWQSSLNIPCTVQSNT